VLAEFNGEATGPALLETCARICRVLQADKLIAGSVWTMQSALKLQDEADNARAETFQVLYRRFERVPVHDISCTLHMEDAAYRSQGLLRIAERERADLLAIAAPAYYAQRGAIDDYLQSAAHLLRLRATPSGGNVGLVFRDLMTGPEPLFN
jgi:hypothetical protein